MSKIYFRYGAMSSGKTALLLQVAHNYEEKGMHPVIMKPAKDTKGEEELVSRIGIHRKVDQLLSDTDDVFLLAKEKFATCSCILIDEAQFLTEEQVNQLLRITITLNIPVICYGLLPYFQTKSFPGSLRLLEIAHSLEEMKTICNCGEKAMFVLRKVNGDYTFTGDQVEIDNQKNVEYTSVCPKCYYKTKEKVSHSVKLV